MFSPTIPKRQVHWLLLADQFQKLAETLPAGETQRLAKKRELQLRSGAEIEEALNELKLGVSLVPCPSQHRTSYR